MKRFILVLVFASAQPLAAQAAGDAVVNSVRPLYEQVKANVIASAEQMPEDNYDYRPTPEVRTFGELIGHVANAQYLFCSAALGESSPNDQNFEEVSSKAELVDAVRAAFSYCDRAYAITDAAALETVSFFGGERTRLGVLTFNATHDNLHYGNIITYLRLNGLVPPSSQSSS